jgi:hypothetical protein
MAPAALLSGRILNDRGQPLQDLRVTPFRWVYDESGGLEPKYFAAEKTNDLGEFRFNNLDEAEYRFRVESPLVVKDPGAYAAGYIPGVMNARDAPSWELHSGTEIRLPDTVLPRSLGERFVLKLVNNTGLTVTGPISINLRRQGDIAPTSAQTVVLTPEQEEIGPLAPGNYDVGVIVNVPGGRLRGSRSVQVPSGQTELNIEVFRNVRLRGSVQATANSGAEVPVGGVRVRLVEQGAFQDVPLSFQSNSDGALAISFVAANGVFPGSFKVKIDRVPANLYVDAVRVGGKDILDGELVVRSDDDLDVRVMLREAPVHIIGRVTNAQGRPTVVVLVPDRENGVPLFRTTLADDRDQFELWTVKGKYRLYAFSELEGAAYRDASFIEKVFAQGTPVDASIEREFSVDVRVLP